MSIITYEHFEQVDLRSGTIIKAEAFERARKPAYKLWIDFGEKLGIKQTSAQVTVHYTPESIIGKQVVACTNLAPKNIAGFMSECLVVGFADENNAVCLVTVDPKVPNGQKLF